MPSPGFVLVVAAALVAAAPSPTPTTVEEVVAVVGGAPLLASDVELARLVHLGEDPDASVGTPPDTLTALIRLELEYRDLESSGGLSRLSLDVPAATARLTERAGGHDALAAALAAHHLDWTDLEALAVRVAAVDSYVSSRLRPRIVVTPDEVEQAYRETVVSRMTAAGATPPPLDTLRPQLERLVFERHLNEEIDRWEAQARERLGVTRFAP